MEPLELSACIITYNEADRIDACLKSLDFCDDIVVVDSGSDDDTRERAEALGARVMVRTFDGYRSQKAFAVQQAHHDWVLCLDADERIDDELRQAIEREHAQQFAGVAGYEVCRLTEYFGKFLWHGNAYPDRLLRLFDRRRGGWKGDREIHETASVGGSVKRLAGHVEHHPYRSLTEQIDKQERYTRMMAEHLYARGKRATARKILLNPIWRFIRSYLLRRGFLDGWRGLFFALLSVGYARRKYIRLWLLENGEKP